MLNELISQKQRNAVLCGVQGAGTKGKRGGRKGGRRREGKMEEVRK